MMKTIRLKLSTKIAAFSFILSFLGIASLAYISYTQSKTIFKNNLIQSTAQEVEKSSLDINKKMDEAKKNIIFTLHSDPVLGILRTTKNRYNYDEEQNMDLVSWKQRLENLFAVIMKQNPSYFQMRLIGVKDNGKELIRVEQSNGMITAIPENKLQYKGDSDYFKETIKLKPQQIFISKINLNREHNIIVTPYIPTIRIATPIYNGDKVYGILIINIDIKQLFGFNKFAKNTNFDTYITNSDGQYIYHKNIDKTFGFEFGKQYLIQNDFNVADVINQKIKHKSFYCEHTKAVIAIDQISLLGKRIIYIMHTANSDYFEKSSQQYINIMISYIITISIIIAILIALLVRFFISPISKLTDAAHKITNGENIDFNKLHINTGDEIEELANSFEFMVESLSQSKEQLQELALNLELDVKEKTKELQKLNDQLEIKVQNAIAEIRKKDDVLQQQSKLASMGEMIGAIAHQWRQPLNALTIQIQGLKYNYKNGDINEEFLKAFISKNKKTIHFMSKTIDDFRSFFRVDKTKQNFLIKQTVQSVLDMQNAQLTNYNIKVNLTGDEFEYYGLQSEFQQVILNIINNAKDVMLERDIQNRQIDIHIDKTKKELSICDNGGGIDQDVIKRVFEPYFTTKEQGKGTGIGLYMSKMIIEDNMNSILRVENKDKGACFIIEFKDENNGK